MCLLQLVSFVHHDLLWASTVQSQEAPSHRVHSRRDRSFGQSHFHSNQSHAIHRRVRQSASWSYSTNCPHLYSRTELRPRTFQGEARLLPRSPPHEGKKRHSLKIVERVRTRSEERTKYKDKTIDQEKRTLRRSRIVQSCASIRRMPC